MVYFSNEVHHTMYTHISDLPNGSFLCTPFGSKESFNVTAIGTFVTIDGSPVTPEELSQIDDHEDLYPSNYVTLELL